MAKLLMNCFPKDIISPPTLRFCQKLRNFLECKKKVLLKFFLRKRRFHFLKVIFNRNGGLKTFRSEHAVLLLFPPNLKHQFASSRPSKSFEKQLFSSEVKLFFLQILQVSCEFCIADLMASFMEHEQNVIANSQSLSGTSQTCYQLASQGFL